MTDFDPDKVIDCMFDPLTASILADLEDGEKKSSLLATKHSVDENEIKNRLSYLIEHDFIFTKIEGKDTVYYANGEKLSSIIENSENFDGAIDGLTKLDSYLN